MNEKVPSSAKTPFVNTVQEASGIEMSVEAQRRNELLAGPVPVTNARPSANFATPVRWGVITIRKIVPPPPGPPAVVDPYRFPPPPMMREARGLNPFVPLNMTREVKT